MKSLLPVLTYRAPEVLLATVPGQVLAVWTDAPTVASVEALGRALEGQLALGLEPTYLGLVVGGVSLPGEPARKAFGALLRRLQGRMPAMAMVVRGEGFGASAVRGVITGLGLAARNKLPLQCFAEVEPAAHWLCCFASSRQSPRAVLESVAELEALSRASRLPKAS